MGTFVQLTAADGFTFPAYVAQPAVQSKGGLVVLQEIFGVNSHIQAVADGYAADGYFVVAPSTFHLVKAVLPGMKARRAGKIINTSSILGMAGRKRSSHYAGAKAALIGLTKAWAREFAEWNIQVNAVAPGRRPTRC